MDNQEILNFLHLLIMFNPTKVWVKNHGVVRGLRGETGRRGEGEGKPQKTGMPLYNVYQKICGQADDGSVMEVSYVINRGGRESMS